jgi:Flp pilus assembly protein TadG
MFGHRRSGSAQRGAALFETALVSGLFFMVLMPVFDFGRTWYVMANLQHATRSTARLITVGALTGTLTNQAVSSLLSKESGMDLTGAVVAVTSTTLSGSGSGAGASGRLITVSARLDVPIVTPFLHPFFHDGVYRANASATFLNEVGV